jgi:hypothetical protein
MKYVRVMNGVTSHASGYQFKLNEVNIADIWNPAANNPKDFGGFNFTDETHVLRWMIRGDTLYDVVIPEDAEVVAVENGNTPGGVWRTNRVIVTNPRVITDAMCLEFCQIAQLPEKTWFHVLAIMAGKGFAQTCDWITQHKVNPGNIELCISEYSEFAFYNDSGIYDAVLTQLSHNLDRKLIKEV